MFGARVRGVKNTVETFQRKAKQSRVVMFHARKCRIAWVIIIIIPPQRDSVASHQDQMSVDPITRQWEPLFHVHGLRGFAWKEGGGGQNIHAHWMPQQQLNPRGQMMSCVGGSSKTPHRRP